MALGTIEMDLPNKLLTGDELDAFLESAQTYSLDSIKNHFAKYEPTSLKKNWFLLLRCVDEFINLSWEIEDCDLRNDFMGLSFNLMDSSNMINFMNVLKKIESLFGRDVSKRLQQFAQMNYASTMAYESHGLNQLLPFDFSTVETALIYYQSRRKYYVTILDLIDEWAIGNFSFEFIDTLNQTQYTIDSCLQNITTNYYSILLNHSLSNYSIDFRQSIPKPSHSHYNLESFLLEPQVLTMLDQIEFRNNQTNDIDLIPLPTDRIFTYSEVQNNIKLIEATFNKYSVKKDITFIELSFLVGQLKEFCTDDYFIRIPIRLFEEKIEPYIKALKLFSSKTDYFHSSNFVSLFQKDNSELITTVVLFNRFITNIILNRLSKNKSFQINSGFVFEDKVSSVLENNGYQLTDIKRINRKEFDIITIKDNHIHNFQCKNNFIDISRIQDDPKRMAKLNHRLIRYYKKAYIKEVGREHLIKQKLGINDITHYVVSRYPVITEIDYIINFNELKEKTKSA
ncbi:hypothetical protein QYS48_05215 [Marivirga arenosa]|uniref:Restriction endonuclease n=1 Tax=Marivirga arenosa TaxID=3059076 RepID=A0AA49GFD2_9BACT|nr:hypothetical protein [Marivirga sp. ABR2-2]WKK86366.2 hypothetical protein QYS48_05215 [Marivirga sp. ABR2-2]